MHLAKIAAGDTSADGKRSHNCLAGPAPNDPRRKRGSRQHRHRRSKQAKRLAVTLLLYLLVFLALVVVANMIPRFLDMQ